jgi:hypothetical protein
MLISSWKPATICMHEVGPINCMHAQVTNIVYSVNSVHDIHAESMSFTYAINCEPLATMQFLSAGCSHRHFDEILIVCSQPKSITEHRDLPGMHQNRLKTCAAAATMRGVETKVPRRITDFCLE